MISEDDWLKMRRQAQLLLELDFSDQAIAITKVPSVQTLAIPIKLEGLFYLKEVFYRRQLPVYSDIPPPPGDIPRVRHITFKFSYFQLPMIVTVVFDWRSSTFW